MQCKERRGATLHGYTVNAGHAAAEDIGGLCESWQLDGFPTDQKQFSLLLLKQIKITCINRVQQLWQGQVWPLQTSNKALAALFHFCKTKTTWSVELHPTYA